jgi:NTE family protein
MSGSDRIGLAGLPRPVAAVVGGGGCLGAAQVGVGVALEERGFVPDLVVGTSVGALNGAIVAAHPGQAAPWLAQVWTDLRRRDVFPLRPRIAKGGVFSSAGIQELIRRAGLPARVEDLSLPFTAIAMDLITGQQAALSAGDLRTALLASAAIPGVLPPVERDGRTLVDGGMIAYVPVGAALAAGAASVVVVSSGPEAWPVAPRRPRLRPTAVAGRASLWLWHHQVERDLQEAARQIPVVVPPTGIESWPPPWDFSQADRLIRTASGAAGRFLDRLDIGHGPGLHRAPGHRVDSAGEQTLDRDRVAR